MSEVLLGVGGGIAAYKSCDLLRRLQDQGHQVTVIPTPASLNFVGKATWEALSGRQVHSEVWDAVHNVNNVQLGDQADYILVAPATADLIARLAVGRADDLLTNAILASDAPKMLVPAMHPKMWLNEATQKNVLKLREIGFVIMEPSVGKLTGGDVGIGRFPDTAEILEAFNSEVVTSKDLTGVKILVTAGGTREAIDDVRFIGNRSSGKQGIAIALNAKARGAAVTLIAANIETKKLANLFGVTCYSLENTEQLRNKLLEEFPKCQVLVMAAAVSDARPNQIAGKVKKDDYRELQLIQNPDLLAELSKIRTKQLIVGFAAEESANLLQEGTRKLHSKGLDLIYANDIESGQLFGSDNTSGLIIDNSGYEEIHPMSKQALAVRLLDKVLERLNSANV